MSQSIFSMFWGEMFFPAAVMMRSFLRSVMRRKPSLIHLADVARMQPSVPSHLASSRTRLEVTQEYVRRLGPRISPSCAIFTSTPGIGAPDGPNLPFAEDVERRRARVTSDCP